MGYLDRTQLGLLQKETELRIKQLLINIAGNLAKPHLKLIVFYKNQA